MYTIDVKHTDNGTTLTVDDFGLAVRLSICIREKGYDAFYATSCKLFIVHVTPKLYRKDLKRLIKEQFNPDVIEVSHWQ